ncbi:MAG: NTP transferase domain-containing protein [Acidobacteria bacterium]|nr:NTP transferase domain-containing protein [Acidobacteriota bacterium]
MTKAVILCGGRGTRLGEHGLALPKALMPIGGQPVIRHLMSAYARHGITEFILCLGHLGDVIRTWFAENDVPWSVQMFDTGVDTNTGGRLLAIQDAVGDGTFCATYGDGLSNIDISSSLAFHATHGRAATIAVVHPISNFGIVEIGPENEVRRFTEKPVMSEWVNGGFFVFNSSIFEYLTADSVLEREPFEQLCAEDEMRAFKHEGFWKCMDTYKDTIEMEKLWREGAPWTR